MPRNWEQVLTTWEQPASGTEEDERDRTTRAVRRALDNSSIPSTEVSIYSKGSYRNRTNVRRNADVDIAVEYRDVFFWKGTAAAQGMSGPDLGITPATGPYSGGNHKVFRQDVHTALRDHFGASSVSNDNRYCVDVDGSSTRLPADVVPCFQFRLYIARGRYHPGIKVFNREATRSTINYPQQHYDNGVTKNEATGGRYKRMVRIFKRLRDEAVQEGRMSEIDSFLVECLVYNTHNGPVTEPSREEALCATMDWLHQRLKSGNYREDDWIEVNKLKPLFSSGQKWSVGDARGFINSCLDHYQAKLG